MYLSQIELHGFKSFADRTVLRFSDGLTAIVGPNGSGKTNIIDAIRWVLGEQKTSLLRTDEMSQVIFNGTRTRKPLGMAEVSITIENTKKILPAEFSEVVVTRRLFRDGESQYLLNGTQCRRRDIVDLFTDTGMGADAYSVIELKMVEQILEDHSDERRHLFEEAAGIVKYKQRRKETLAKLEAVRNDIERIVDHLTEVRRNVASLKRQAERAEQYHRLKEELNALERDKHFLSYQRYAAHLDELEQQFTTVTAQKQHIITSREHIQRQIELLNAEINRLDQHRQALISQEQETNKLLADITRTCAVLQERISSTNNAVAALLDRVHMRSATHDKLISEMEQCAQLLKSLDDERSLIEQERAQLLAQLDRERSTLEALNRQLEQVVEPLRALEREQERCLTLRVQLRRNVEHVHQHSHDLRERLSQATAERKAIEADRDRLQSRYQQLQEQLRLSEERFVQARARRDELDERIERLHAERHHITDELSQLRAEHVLLSAITESPELQLSGNDSLPLATIVTIGDLISAPKQWKIAVESALEGAHHYLVVESHEQVESLRRWLHNQGHKKVHVVCTELIPYVPAPGPLPPDSGAQWLSSLIECSEPLTWLIGILLEGIAAVDSLDDADKLFATVPQVRACVDRQGQLRYRHGIFRIGSALDTEGMSIGRTQRLQQLDDRIAQLQHDLDAVNRALSEAIAERDTLELGTLAEEVRNAERSMMEIQRALDELVLRQHQLDRLIQGIEDELTTIAQEQAVLVADDFALEEQLHAIEQNQAEYLRQHAELNKRLQEQHGIISRLEDSIRDKELAEVRLRSRLESLHDTIARLQQQQTDLAGAQQVIEREHQQLHSLLSKLEAELAFYDTEQLTVRTRLDALIAERQRIDLQLADRRRELSSAQQQATLLQSQLEQVENRFHELQLEAERVRTLRDLLTEQARSELGIELAQYSPSTPTMNAAQLDSQIARLRSQIASLGAINFSALEQYRSERERLEQLEQQYRDLQQSEANLRETIANINTTASDLFLRTFESIRKNFQELFTLLFHGDGDADLTLEGDDPLEARINIIARPKGKRPLSIEMLSGGEKTLTAIALLFALYMVKPSPFCILDEVDAPLDDANIDRYLHLIRRFSATTQFLLITHNKRTMEAADVLYGVTMQEPGVSKIVSVRLTDSQPVSPSSL